MPYTGQDWRSTGDEWIRTETGWILTKDLSTAGTQKPHEEGLRSMTTTTHHRPDVRGASLASRLQTQGSKGQRRLSSCLSDVLTIFDMKNGAKEVRKFQFIYELISIVLTEKVGNISGTATRQLLLILEVIVNQAIESQVNMKLVKELVSGTLSALQAVRAEQGCANLWNRHIQTVSNLKVKLDNTQCAQRLEDGKPTLTDLPKECLREILFRLTDHRDVLHLGAANEDLYYMSRDPKLWTSLTNFHFCEKQIMKVTASDNMEDLEMQHVFPKCYRRFGLKKTYADMLVVCSGCKALVWRINTHQCFRSTEETENDTQLPCGDPVGPQELLQILGI